MILGCHVICWCWSTVFSEVHSQHSHLPGHFRALHASFGWQALWRCWFHFPAGLAPAHTANSTKSWFNDHGATVLDWPANSPDLNPIENLWGIVKRKLRDTRPNNADDLKTAIKATWASITPEQCQRLIASMPRYIDAVIHAKGGPTKYWVHRNELFRSLTFLFKISFFIDLVKYSNFLRHWIWGFHYLKAMIIQISRNKGLKYFPLCVMNLYNIWVSLSEMSDKKYWPFSWYSNFFTCTCICV